LVKMCHRHLPIGQTLHRRNSKYTPTCPGCLTEHKTQDHFLKSNFYPPCEDNLPN
jgi:hypothetical protein